MAELPPWAPASAAVAPHLRSFTRDDHGNVHDDFNDATPIRKPEVDAAIADITGDVIALVGVDVPDELTDQAAAVVAVGAAAQAVVDLDGDLHSRLASWYADRLARLKVAVTDAQDGNLDGVSSMPATGSFPEPFDVTRRAF